ncbi:hypothetical protein BN1708_013076 [Verticillium longisporum]|nr:hypothetical protein BN1708_013076 [Verticillium longisporum]
MRYQPRKPLARRMSASPTRLGTHSATTSLLLPSDEELSSTIENQRKSNGQRLKQHAWLRGWWWWWEIAGCLVSITGCGLLFMMLGSIDQSSRLSWHGFLNIEPNTYIAIIATASRTAIMVPIASCLSQLKWRHFQNRPHRLSHLDLIDNASRGPWGSLQALFRLGLANMVISMLAITTILSLAIGPSVQQVLEIHTRETINHGRVPLLAYATNYTSKVSYWTQNITTLGMCVSIDNVTQHTTRTCSDPSWQQALEFTSEDPFQNNTTWEVDCTYNISEDTYGIQVPSKETGDDIPYRSKVNWVFRGLANSQEEGLSSPFQDLQYLQTNTFRGFANLTILEGLADERSIRTMVSGADILTIRPTSDFNSEKPPDVEVHRVLFYFCAETYSNMNATSPGVDTSRYASFTEPLRSLDLDKEDDATYWVAPSTGTQMMMDPRSRKYVMDSVDFFLKEIPDSNTSAPTASAENPIGFTPERYMLKSPLGAWIWYNGVEDVISNVAMTLRDLIRTKELGDNIDAQMLEGEQFTEEVFFNVRWAWMAVISFEILFVTVLLVFTMVLTRNDSLVKDSSFALLVHSLDGWDKVCPPTLETTEPLDRLAKTMTAKLEADGDGILKFRRQDGG